MDLLSTERAEVERLAEWPANGKLGLRKVDDRSILKEELRLEAESKCPDLFSRKVAVRANPESFRDMGVVGVLEKCGEGGGLPFVERAVDGRSTRVRSTLDCKKALKTNGLADIEASASPKVVEFWLTYFARVLGGAFWVNRDGNSDENALYGNVSMA